MTAKKSSRAVEASSPEVDALIAASDVWDMTIPWMPLYWDLDILARYRRAGFTFVSMTVQDWPATFENTKDCIAQFKAMAAPASDWLTFGTSLADIDRGRREGKLVIGLHSQETRIIGEDLSKLQAVRDLGIRHMLLAYNVRNIVADGCAEAADAGLSNFGRAVVREMDRVGLIVDGTHTGRRSSLEAIDLSERPVIFSHSGAYKVCAHIRNIHDDQIRACAARGGVVGVVGVGAFLGDVEARTETMFRHIDYMVSMVGPEHVGLGTDFIGIMPVSEHEAAWEAAAMSNTRPWPDPAIAWPDPTGTQIPTSEGRCFAPEQLHELVAMMLGHGYPAEAVKGVLGANFGRVYATLP